MFKVNNRNTRTRCEICSKLAIKIPERRCSGTSAGTEFYSALPQWLFSKNRDRLSYGLDINFAPIAPGSQDLLDLILDNSKVSDEAPVIDVVSRCSIFLD